MSSLQVWVHMPSELPPLRNTQKSLSQSALFSHCAPIFFFDGLLGGVSPGGVLVPGGVPGGEWLGGGVLGSLVFVDPLDPPSELPLHASKTSEQDTIDH